MLLEGKVAVVTGGASGIGAAMVRRFAAEGARVFLGDLQAAAGAALADELGEAVQSMACDVTKEADVRALVTAAVEAGGRLDVICNNAGIEVTAPTIATQVADWARTLDVNLSGVFYGCQAALEHMIPGGGGVILNTASIAGIAAAPGLAAYSASKGGVVLLSQTVALENAPFNVRCNAICPGLIDTPMAERALADIGDDTLKDRMAAAIPARRWGRPEEIGALAAFLASDQAGYITGQAIVIDGGLSQSNSLVADALLRGAE